MKEPVSLGRVDINVMCRILGALEARARPSRKTELGMAARVNYTSLQKYLLIAQRNGLVDVIVLAEGTVLVTITDIGRQARRDLNRWQMDNRRVRHGSSVKA